MSNFEVFFFFSLLTRKTMGFLSSNYLLRGCEGEGERMNIRIKIRRWMEMEKFCRFSALSIMHDSKLVNMVVMSLNRK